MAASGPLRNMPPVAAAATECWLMGSGGNTRKMDPNKDTDKYYVDLHGDLIVRYRMRAVGGPAAVSQHLHDEAPLGFSKQFEISRPDTFFHSYMACSDAIHQMLKETPFVGDFDLGPDNWEGFLPHDMAATILGMFRRDTDEHGGVAPPRFNAVDMPVTILVQIIYNEPKALLLACGNEAAAVLSTMPAGAGECCICMEDLAAAAAAATKDSVIRLPCSHSFHRRCILPWFYKVDTCPMCRRDMAKYLVALTNTPKGNFPGLRPPI